MAKMERNQGNGPYAVLLVPAAPDTVERIGGLLGEDGGRSSLRVAKDVSEALRFQGEGGSDVVLLEARSMNAQTKALSRLRDLFPQLPVIIISEREDMAMCDRALQDGAQDYLLKERLTPFGLARSIRFAIDRQRMLATQDARIRELSADLRRHRTLVETSPDGLLVVGEEGTVFFANPMAGRILGRSGHDLLGTPFGYPVIEGNPAQMEVARADRESAVAELTAAEVSWEGEAAYVVALRETTARAEREFLQHRRIEAERLVSMISALFADLEPERLDHGVQESLRMLGEFVQADRAVLWLYSPDGLLVRPAFEWSASGVASAAGRPAAIPSDALGWLTERLSIFETALVSDAASLPREAGAERAMLDERGVATLVAVNLTRGGGRMGFAAFEALRPDRMWSEEDIGLLRTAAEICAGALRRGHGEIRSRVLQGLVEALAHGDADGILVEDRSGAAVEINAAARNMAGLAEGEAETAAGFLRRLAATAADPAAARAALERLAASGESPASVQVVLRGGRSVRVEVQPLLLRAKVESRLWRLRPLAAAAS